MSALQSAGILAANHRELVELAVEQNCDMSARLAEVGDSMDAFIRQAFEEGVPLFQMWRVTHLPVIYPLGLVGPDEVQEQSDGAEQ